jgi:hypothetical protein
MAAAAKVRIFGNNHGVIKKKIKEKENQGHEYEKSSGTGCNQKGTQRPLKLEHTF